MQIDLASPEEAGALAAIFTTARRAAMPWLPRIHTQADDLRFITGLVAGSGEVLVARHRSRPLGFVALSDLMLEHLYVASDAQRAGIGSALLETAKSRRPAGLRLWVFQRNEGALAFYARHGFTEIERTDGAGNEEGEPDVLLAWRGRAPA